MAASPGAHELVLPLLRQSGVIERIPSKVITAVVSANLRLAHGCFNAGISGTGVDHGGIDGEGAWPGGDRATTYCGPRPLKYRPVPVP